MNTIKIENKNVLIWSSTIIPFGNSMRVKESMRGMEAWTGSF